MPDQPLQPRLPPRTLLGRSPEVGTERWLSDADLVRHILVIGHGSQAETLRDSLLSQNIKRGGGALVIDDKPGAGTLVWLQKYVVSCGREADLLIIDPANPAESLPYNPILRGSVEEVAQRVMDIVDVPGLGASDGSDRRKLQAYVGLLALIGALRRVTPKYTVMDLAMLLADPTAVSRLESRFLATAPEPHCAKRLSEFLAGISAKPGEPINPEDGLRVVDHTKLKSLFGGLGGRLFAMGIGNFGRVLAPDTPGVDLAEVIRQKKIVYFALPVMGQGAGHRSIGRLLLGDLRAAVSLLSADPERDRSAPPFMVFLPDATDYLTPSTASLHQAARTADVSMCLFTHSLDSFCAVSPVTAERVMANTWTKVFFKLAEAGSSTPARELARAGLGAADDLSHLAHITLHNPDEFLAVTADGYATILLASAGTGPAGVAG